MPDLCESEVMLFCAIFTPIETESNYLFHTSVNLQLAIKPFWSGSSAHELTNGHELLPGPKILALMLLYRKVGSSMKTLECSYITLFFGTFSDVHVCQRKDPRNDSRMHFKSKVCKYFGISDSETNAAEVHLCLRTPVFSFLRQNFEFLVI